MSDGSDDYDGHVGYGEGHAVFDKCGDDDRNATASDDVCRVYEGHDGRHDRCGKDEDETPAETFFLDASDKSKRQ